MSTATAPATVYRVLVFGQQAQLTGSRELTVRTGAAPITAAALLDAVAKQHAPLRDSLAASRLAVDADYAAPGDVVRPESEIALIGMIGGG